MSQQQAAQSPPSSNFPRTAAPRTPQHRSLRFQDAALESRFITQIMLQDRTGSRNILITTLLAVLLFSVTDFRLMPSEVAWTSLLLRIPLFSICAFGWTSAIYQKEVTRWSQPALMCFALGASLALISPLWIGWLYQIYIPYQILLLVPMLSCFIGCLAWRYCTVVTFGSALALALLEVCYQPDANVRNLHLAYILCAAFFSFCAGYIRERQLRQHFLVGINFLEQSRRDPLTGLPNRRELDFFLPRILRQAARERVAIAVAMIDVDHFKDYNDHYGHAAGDRVLSAVGEAISSHAQYPPDFVARYGGEEFAAIWFNPTHDGTTLGEGLRRAVQETNIVHERSGRGMVSISVGVTSQYPTARTKAPALLAGADRALYRAKNSGRNCVKIDSIAALLATQSAHGMPPDEAARTADKEIGFLSLIPATADDRKRWNRIRGLYEWRALRQISIANVFVHFLLALVNFFNLTPSVSHVTIMMQAIIVVPTLLIGCYLCPQPWAQKHARLIVPAVVIICGSAFCYSFYSAFSHGIDIPFEKVPYEIMLLTIFQVYVIGGQSWRSAALTAWLLTFMCIIIWAVYTSIDLVGLAGPFVTLNILGAFVAMSQDRRGMDTFLKSEKLENIASQDTLTGLANRQGLENYFRTLLPLLDQSERIVAVAMVDIDHFKDYNDHYGHAAGDAVLTAIGQELAEQRLRPYDFAARYGGEEFLLIWYHIREKDARTLGERVCQGVRDLNIPHEKSRHGRVTVSIGIAHGTISADNSMKNLDRMIRRADTALYRAKATGRNRLVLQSEHLLPQGAQEPPADALWHAGQGLEDDSPQADTQ